MQALLPLFWLLLALLPTNSWGGNAVAFSPHEDADHALHAAPISQGAINEHQDSPRISVSATHHDQVNSPRNRGTIRIMQCAAARPPYLLSIPIYILLKSLLIDRMKYS